MIQKCLLIKHRNRKHYWPEKNWIYSFAENLCTGKSIFSKCLHLHLSALGKVPFDLRLFIVFIRQLLKVLPFEDVITKATLSPQLFKDPEWWSAGVELTTSRMAARCSTTNANANLFISDTHQCYDLAREESLFGRIFRECVLTCEIWKMLHVLLGNVASTLTRPHLRTLLVSCLLVTSNDNEKSQNNDHWLPLSRPPEWSFKLLIN